MTASGSKPESYGSHDAPVSESQSDSSHRENALIATYRSEPGQPSFIAEMFDWNFSVHPSDAEFAFQPPEGATQVELKPAKRETSTKPKGANR